MATVTEIQDAAYAASTVALAQGNAFIAELLAVAQGDITPAEPLPDVQYLQDATGNTSSILTLFSPTRPEFNDLSVTLPTAPSPTFSTAPAITVDDFTATAPSLNIPATPSTALPTAPVAPAISDPNMPDAPTLTMPTAPVLATITLPLPPSVDVPSFTAGLPSEDFFTPTNNFEFYEERYSSDLLTELQEKLLDNLQNGGYGIEANDEQDLFQRARDREVEANLAEVDEVYRAGAARGFSLPPGALFAAEQRAHQALANKLSGVSRDIALKRSELYVQNRQFTLEQTRALEQILIGFHNSVQERALNVAKYALEAGIKIYETQLARYNARLEAYRVEAQVFESKIRASLAQMEIYRTQMEGSRLELESQKAQVDIYRAQLASIESVVNIYRARVEAVGVQMSVERIRIDAFRGLIDAYQAQVQAKVAEFGMYRAQIDGETAKVSAYEAQARAYTAKVEGAKVRSDIALGNLRQETEQARALIDVYRGQMQGAELDLKAQSDTLSATVGIYNADIAAYNASANAMAEALRLDNSKGQANKEIILAAAKLQIENMRAELEALKTNVDAKISASSVAGRAITAQIAGIQSSINAVATKAE